MSTVDELRFLFAEARVERDEARTTADSVTLSLKRAIAETQEIAAELAEERTLHQRTLVEVERLRAVVDRVRALHSPEPGWEREWAYPEHALANGWPRCAGCLIEGVAHREIGDCPTLRALNERATGEDRTDG